MSSRLPCLAPEYGSTSHLIRLGGHFRQTQQLEESTIHPIVLNLQHPLSIQEQRRGSLMCAESSPISSLLLADHLWRCFVCNNLPELQVCQK